MYGSLQGTKDSTEDSTCYVMVVLLVNNSTFLLLNGFMWYRKHSNVVKRRWNRSGTGTLVESSSCLSFFSKTVATLGY